MRLFLSVIMVFFLLACGQDSQEKGPRPIRVLFLGHKSDHHNSKVYMPMLQASLAPKGFYFTYSDDPADLNEDNLASYDAVMLYANHDSIKADEANALLKFVKKGGGFLPVHSASYCFRNNEEVVRLIGGQFESHDTATFSAEIILPDHPAMKEVTPFTSWDETYRHTKLTDDRTVLMERVDTEGREPYTWVKEYGKGRVFYTALGHDERTWSRPEFHGLLEQGLCWVIGDHKAQMLAALDLPELKYSEAKIPNYEARNPPPKLQAPLDPDVSQKRIQIPPGFSLHLFASEPEISKPISASWDHRGRLWLLESEDYPNDITFEEGKGSDRIKILEDTDGDGKADRFTVFADKLSVPTSLVFSNGGVIVSQAPHFLFLKDNDGDDVADERRILFSGWGTFDTHAGPSNLQYGFDNQIWGVVGYSSFEGKVGEQQHQFRQGAYRFKPDGSHLEFMGSTTNNTWGLGFNEAFDVFISTANNTHSAYLGISHRYFDGVEGLKIKSVKKIETHYAFHPNTHNVRQVDVFGGFTAAAGHHLYTARQFPQEYWNRIALVCEPTGHLLHRAILEPDGAGFKEMDGWNLLASSDEWVSPVHAQVGPDGAVWILDWYNFIIQHNPTPPGFENGKGNAHINPLRDKKLGRIYKLVYNQAKKSSYPEIGPGKSEENLAALKNDNLFWRLHAQRFLVENGDQSIKDKLLQMLEDRSMDAAGINAGVIHALWTLEGLGLIQESNKDVLQAVYQALEHPSAAVRKNAVRVLPVNESNFAELEKNKMWFDPDLQVRLPAILSVIDLADSKKAGTILYELTLDSLTHKDEWLSRAVYAGAVRHKETFIMAVNNREHYRIESGYKDPKIPMDFSSNTVDISNWNSVEVPRNWSLTSSRELQNFDGIVWMKYDFEIPATWSGKKAVVHLGPIDDTDATFLNGKKIGGLDRKWDEIRKYSVPGGLLKPGKNQITVRISDSGGRGGIYGTEEQVYLEVGQDKLSLAGMWKYIIEEKFTPEIEVFKEGLDIVDLFLKHYGPYAKEISGSLAGLPFDQVIEMQTLPDQMRYDKELLEVKAGSRVKIIFRNNDGMQHNLLIGEPGSLEIIGKAADQMAQTSDGMKRHYIPVLNQILAAAGLVDPGEFSEIIWQVPEEAGEYLYVCTFPGHWRTMNGKIQVRAREVQ